MKIPKKIYFEGHTYNIKYSKKIFLNKQECYAIVDKSNLSIHLQAGLKKSVKEETFFHELMHLCENEEKPLKESTLDDLSRRLYAVLKNNNLLVNSFPEYKKSRKKK